VKWITAEADSDSVTALFDRPITWLAPRLLLVEATTALRRKVAGRLMAPIATTSALAILLDAVGVGKILLAADEELVAEALSLALMLDHRVADCLYLALAEREGAALATADAGLGLLARSRNLPVLGIGAAAV
jgi:predicted nucleic acid-binding protein